MAELVKFDRRRTLGHNGGYMLRLSPTEAMRTAISLLMQLESRDSNTQRYEHRLKDEKTYFSIAVDWQDAADGGYYTDADRTRAEGGKSRG